MERAPGLSLRQGQRIDVWGMGVSLWLAGSPSLGKVIDLKAFCCQGVVEWWDPVSVCVHACVHAFVHVVCVCVVKEWCEPLPVSETDWSVPPQASLL